MVPQIPGITQGPFCAYGVLGTPHEKVRDALPFTFLSIKCGRTIWNFLFCFPNPKFNNEWVFTSTLSNDKEINYL